MLKMSSLFLSLFFVTLLFSQERAIKITNQTSKKEIKIKENKRIKIKTTDGEKISGRFKIHDDTTILIKNKQIELINIKEIKRNSLLLSIFTSGFFIYSGALTAGFGVLIGVLVDSTAFLLTIPAAGMIYTGIKSPNFQKKYKGDSNWIFELISTSD